MQEKTMIYVKRPDKNKEYNMSSLCDCTITKKTPDNGDNMNADYKIMLFFCFKISMRTN